VLHFTEVSARMTSPSSIASDRGHCGREDAAKDRVVLVESRVVDQVDVELAVGGVPAARRQSHRSRGCSPPRSRRACRPCAPSTRWHSARLPGSRSWGRRGGSPGRRSSDRSGPGSGIGRRSRGPPPGSCSVTKRLAGRHGHVDALRTGVVLRPAARDVDRIRGAGRPVRREKSGAAIPATTGSKSVRSGWSGCALSAPA